MTTLELVFWALCGLGVVVGLALMVIAGLTSWNERQPFGPGRSTVAEEWPASSEERECQRRFVVECQRRRGRKVMGERLVISGQLRRV